MCVEREKSGFFITSKRVKLYYLIWEGPMEGVPVVCVHGLTSNCRYFCALAEELTKDRTVYSYDLRGRGDSDKPESSCGYGIACHAMDLHEFLTWLDLPAVHLVGHSFGAAIIVYYLTHYEAPFVEKVVLIEGGMDYPPHFREQIAHSINRLGLCYRSLEQYWEAMKKIPHYHPWNEYYEHYLRHDVEVKARGWVVPKTPQLAVYEDIASLTHLSLNDLLPKIRQETLVVRATRGFRYPKDYILSPEMAREMVRRLPRGILLEVPHTHHISIVLGKAGLSAQFIRRFLADSAAGLRGKRVIM